MQSARVDSQTLQFHRDVLGRVFGGDEDQRPLPAMMLNQMTQELRASFRINRDGALLNIRRASWDGADIDADRITQQQLGERLHGRRESCREQQVLTTVGQKRQHAGELVGETFVEKAIRLVEHQSADFGQAHGVVIGEIEQSARRGHDDIRAASQRHHLRIDRDTAEHREHLDRLRQVPTEAAERFAHLHRELRVGAITRPLDATIVRRRTAQQSLQHRQGVRRGLAGARLRAREYILRAQDRRDGGGLNGRWAWRSGLRQWPEAARATGPVRKTACLMIPAACRCEPIP